MRLGWWGGLSLTFSLCVVHSPGGGAGHDDEGGGGGGGVGAMLSDQSDSEEEEEQEEEEEEQEEGKGRKRKRAAGGGGPAGVELSSDAFLTMPMLLAFLVRLPHTESVDGWMGGWMDGSLGVRPSHPYHTYSVVLDPHHPINPTTTNPTPTTSHHPSQQTPHPNTTTPHRTWPPSTSAWGTSSPTASPAGARRARCRTTTPGRSCCLPRCVGTKIHV